MSIERGGYTPEEEIIKSEAGNEAKENIESDAVELDNIAEELDRLSERVKEIEDHYKDVPKPATREGADRLYTVQQRLDNGISLDRVAHEMRITSLFLRDPEAASVQVEAEHQAREARLKAKKEFEKKGRWF